MSRSFMWLWHQGWVSTVAGTVSASCLALVFYWPHLSLLCWIALVPWFLFVWGSNCHDWRSAGLAGAMAGLVYYGAILLPLTSVSWWGWGTVSVQQAGQVLSQQRLFMLGVWSLATLWGGLWWGGWSVLLWRLRGQSLLTRWVLAPVLWIVLLETIGYATVFQYSWGWLGSLMAQDVVTRQLASLFGVKGISWLIVMMNTTLALAAASIPAGGSWINRLRSLWTNRPVRFTLVRGGVLAVACLAYSVCSVARPLTVAPQDVLRVALLQGNVTNYTPADFTPQGLDRVYGELIERTLQQPVDLMVLPESVWLATLSLDGSQPSEPDPYLMHAQAFHAGLAHRLLDRPTLLAFGLDTVQGSRPHNSLLYWSSQGPLGIYHKRALVPFAEYRPALLGRLAPDNQLHHAEFAYAPGHAPMIVSHGVHRFGSIICQEILRPDLVRDTVRAGASLLLTTGNEGVFKNPLVARIQLDAARLRSVEQRRWMVRTTKTGPSALIDPWGRVTIMAPQDRRAIVTGRVTDLRSLTPYAQWGTVGMLALLGLVVTGLSVIGPYLRKLRYDGHAPKTELVQGGISP